MTDNLDPIRTILAELKRRRVFRVAGVYGATAFVVIEAADIAFPRLGLPDWTVTFVVALALIGFPLALVLAWAYELTPEGVRRTAPATDAELESIVKQPRSKRWPAGLAAAAAVALLLAGVWFTVGRDWVGGQGTATPALPRVESAVAVLPFTAQTSPAFGYLREGMVSLLSTKLDGAGDLRSVDPRTLLRFVGEDDATVADPAAAGAVADRFGAGYFIMGDLVEAGGRIQLAAALYDRDDIVRPVGEGSVEGDVDRLFELVDELAARLLSGMSGGPAARVRRIAAVTTSSLPALKSFFEGEELFRRAQFGAAVEAFSDAVAADSTFALAWYRLSLTAEWNLQDDLAREAAEQAVRYDERLAERDRRMLEAFVVRRRGANREAEQMYRSILGTYPDEMEAWLDLAEVLFHAAPLHGKSFTGSREALERVLAFDPNHSTALIHLSRVAAYEGNRVELDSLVDAFMRLNPEPERTLELEALRAFALRDSASIEATMTRLARAEDPGVALAVWAAAVYAQNLSGAQRIAALLTAEHRSPEARRLGFAWLAHAALAAGKWRDAQKQLDRLEELDSGTALEYRALLSNIPFVPVRDAEVEGLLAELEELDPASVAVSDNPSVTFTAHDRLHPLIRLYLLGITNARLGRGAEAERYAARMPQVELPRIAGSLDRDLAHSIRARVLIEGGDTTAALAELGKAEMHTWYGQTLASPFYCKVFERFTRAEILLALDRPREALGWYANLVETSVFELPYLASAHLRRAEIHESLGELERAMEHYARFIELWRDADPELQSRVEAARQRLAALAAN
jgi:tetratricopeptide (TPR) repeat protein